MKKLVLAGISLVAVVLLTLSSQTTVIGNQTVQVSQQERVDPLDLVIDLIVDCANNQEVQQTIVGCHVKNGPIVHLLPRPTITKAQISVLLLLGRYFTRTGDEKTLPTQYREQCIGSPVLQERLMTVIKQDSRLMEDLGQLSASDCDCEEGTSALWHFPITCGALWVMTYVVVLIIFSHHSGYALITLGNVLIALATLLNCQWL